MENSYTPRLDLRQELNYSGRNTYRDLAGRDASLVFLDPPYQYPREANHDQKD